MNKRKGSLITKSFSQILMIVITLTILFPLYFLFINSVKLHEQYVSDPIGIPNPFTLGNYSEAFIGKPFGQWILNSLLLTVAATIACEVVAFLAAYAFAKMKFKGKNSLFNIIVPLMSVPPVAMLVPQFKMVVGLNLINTRTSVIFIYVGILLPMTIYLVRNFLVSVPDSLLEAATIDGCGSLTTLFRIIIPLSKPALITSSLVNIVWIWNELLIALVFLQREELRTLMVGITLFRGRFTLDVPVVMAGMAIATIPMIIIYAFAQDSLVEGIYSGSIKE